MSEPTDPGPECAHTHLDVGRGERGRVGQTGAPGGVGKTGAKGQRGRRGTMPIQQLGVYLLVVLVAAYGLFEIREVGLANDRASVAQRQELCVRSVENRAAVRQLSQDVTMLLRGLIASPGAVPSAALEDLERQLAVFEEQQLVDLPPLACPEVPAE